MRLYCNFEELSALGHGAHTLLQGGDEGDCAVAAPSASRAAVEAFLPRLDSDVAIATLIEQRSAESALVAIVECLRIEMESAIGATHAADEQAVSAYFEYAHAFSVLGRVQEMGREMEALIELVTGRAPTADIARDFVFPN
jgi:hypothetical protein